MRKLISCGVITLLAVSSAQASVFGDISNLASSAKTSLLTLFADTPVSIPGVTHFRNHTTDVLTIVYSGDNNPTVTVQPNAEIALADKESHQIVSINGVALSAFQVKQEMATSPQYIYYHSYDANNDEYYDVSSTAAVMQQKFTNISDGLKNIENVQVSNEQALTSLDKDTSDLQTKINNYDNSLAQNISFKTDVTKDNQYTKSAQSAVDSIATPNNLAIHIQQKIKDNIKNTKLYTNDYFVSSIALVNEQGNDFIKLELSGNQPLRCDTGVPENNRFAYIDLAMPNARYLVSHASTAFAAKTPLHLKVASQEFDDPSTDIGQIMCVVKAETVRK